MLKKIALVSAGLLLVASPLFASAQTTDVQSQLNALLAQLAQLQAQIQALQSTAQSSGSVTPTPPSATEPASSECTSITSDLSYGSSGAQVLALQNFLIGQGLLTSDSASGYFGPLTQTAVQEWQASKGIVSSGTPDTTGFGAVGPETAAAISAACASTGSPTSSPGSSKNPAISTTNTVQGQTCGAGTTGTYPNCVPMAMTITTAPGSDANTQAVGRISASGCTIAAGSGTCSVSLSWSSSNTNNGLVDIDFIPFATSSESNFYSMQQYSLLPAEAGNASYVWNSSLQQTFGPGTYAFVLYDHNPANTATTATVIPPYATPLSSSESAVISCAAGTSWNSASDTCQQTTAATTVTPAAGATLTANTTQINQGQSVTLTWSSSGDAWCDGGDNNGGPFWLAPNIPTNSVGAAVVAPSSLSGNVTLMPTVTTTYVLSCRNLANSDSNNATVTVYVLPPNATSLMPTVTLTASPSTVSTGQSTTLTWATTNAQSCTGTGFSTGGALNGSVSVTPTAISDQTYEIVCYGAGGAGAGLTNSALTTVDINAGPAATTPSVTLTATPASITAGQSTTLTWSGTNLGACELGSASGVKGLTSVSPNQTTTYTVNCLGGPNDAEAASNSVLVTVTPAPAPTCPAGTTGTYPTCTLAGSTISTSVTSITSASAFWNNMFTCILNRTPSSAEVTAWQNVGVTSLGTAYHDFFDSAEYIGDNTSNQTYVNQLYQCVLFRVADSQSSTWVADLQNGTTRDQLLSEFLNSSEFQTTQGPSLQAATGLSIAVSNTQALSQLASALTGLEAILKTLLSQ